MTYRLLKSTTFAVAMLALVCVGNVRADDEDTEGEEHAAWSVSFEEAKAQAEAEGKSILMEFTGSDWCPPCIALHDNVLVSDVFNSKVPENFVLLKLDNPRDKSEQSEEEIAQYQELSQKYAVSGVPTVVLANAEGLPYASMVGYNSAQSAEAYVENLENKLEDGAKLAESLAGAQEAMGVEKAKLLDAALEGMEPALMIAFYGDVIDDIIELDADNEAGLGDQYAQLRRNEEIKADLNSILRSVDRENLAGTVEQLDQLVEEKEPTGELLQQIYYYQGSMYMSLEEPQKAKETLSMAQKIAPESRLGMQISRIMAQQFPEDADDDSDGDDGDGN